MRRRLKKKRIMNQKEKIIFFFASVLLTTWLLFSFFNKKATPKLIHVASIQFEKMVDEIASDYKTITKFEIPLENLLTITKNNKGEILTVDYNMSEIYTISHLMSEHLKLSIDELNVNVEDKIKERNKKEGINGVLLMLPLGSTSNYLFLNNLGPKLPILVRFIDSVYTNVKTKITNYGINSCLAEVYLEVSLKYELVTPITSEQQKMDYSILLNAKIISGEVPNWYGGELTTKSNSVNSPVL